MKSKQPAADKAKILIVDDELIVASDIKSAVEKLGYDVIGIAGDADQALELIKDITPDIILMDIMLKDSIDGIALSEIIVEKIDVPIVFVTAYSDKETVERAKKVEPYSYLTKPFNNRDLFNAIEISLYKHNTEKKLKEKEERYSTILEVALDGFWIVDAATRKLLEVNQAYVKMSGYSKEELLSMSISDLEVIESPEETKKHIELVREKGDDRFESVHRRKDGTHINVEVSVQYISLEEGIIICFLRDITEKKRVDRENKLLAEMLNDAPGAITIHNMKGEFLYANQKTFQIHGYSEKEFMSIKLHQLDVPESAELIEERIRKILEEGEAQFEVRHYCKDGTSIPLDITARIVDWKGERAILSVATDLRERKRAEHELRQKEEGLKMVLENLSDAVFAHDLNGKILMVNQASSKQTGYSREELINMYVYDIDPDVVDRDDRAKFWSQLMPGDIKTIEVVHKRKDGSLYSAEVRINLMIHDLEPIILATTRDITERKLNEDRLAYREQFEKILLEVSGKFVNISMDEYDKVFSEALEKIGNFCKVDRSYIFLFDWESMTTSNTHEWCNNGILPVIDELQNVPVDTLPVWTEKIRNLEDVCIPSVQELSEEWCAEREFLTTQGIQSLIAIPLFHSDNVIGFVGFDSVNRLRDWAEEEIKLLRILSNIFSAAFENRRGERELRSSEQKLSSIFRVSPSGIGVVLNRIFVEVNPGVCEISGYTKEELIGKSARMLYPTQEEYEFVGNEKYRQINIKGQGEVETVWKKKDGTIINVWLASAPIDRNDLDKGVIFTVLDITEQKQVLMKLKKSEEKFRQIFETANEGICSLNESYNITLLNQKMAEMLGYNFDELLGRSLLDFIHPEEIEDHLSKLEERKRGEKGLYERGFCRKDGSIIWTIVSATPLMNEKGEFFGSFGMFTDITKIKETERALIESEVRFRSLIEFAPVSILLLQDGKYVYGNPTSARLLGYNKPEDLIGVDALTTIAPEFRDTVIERIKNIQQGFENESFEIQVVRHSGERIWTSSTSVPIVINGKNTAIIVGLDISERKHAEAALIKSQSELKAIYDSTPVMMCVVNTARRILYANPAFIKYMGISDIAFVDGSACGVFGCINALDDPRGCGYGRNCSKCILRCSMQETFDTGTSCRDIEYQTTLIKNNDAKTVTLLGSTSLISNGDEKKLLLSLLDITERIEAQNQLRKSEERLALATKGTGIGIWDYNVKEDRLEWDDLMFELFDVRKEEFGGKFEDWEKSLLHEKLPEAVSNFQTALKEGEEFIIEFPIQRSDGSITYLAGSGFITRDEQGEPVRVVGINYDITERKKVEEQIKNSLREKEILLKEIHHRVKNNFQVLISLMNLESDRIKDKNVLQILGDSQNRIRSMALVHERLYKSDNFLRIDFSAFIQDLLNILEGSYLSIADNINIETNIGDVHLTLDSAVPCGLIFNELVSNIFKHAFPGNRKGKILIEMNSEEEEVFLRVKDDGVGLPAGFDISSPETLGYQLIISLTDQIDGNLQVKNKGGTEVIISFKKN